MISFWIKEAFKLIARSKFSFLLALISITLSIVLITLSVIIIRFSDYYEKQLRSNLVISIFVNDGLNEAELQTYKNELFALPFTSQIEYIDKDKAAEIFIKETGEDFRKILDYNPLPVSFNLKIKESYSYSSAIKNIIKQLSEYKWANEIVFRQDFYQKILTYIDEVKTYIFVLTGLIFLVSIYLVYSTVRLILDSKYSEMETMKFVGAKLSTIKMPIIINSFITGSIAGIFAFLIFFVANQYLLKYFLTFDSTIINRLEILTLIFVLGPLIDIFVTVLSLRKISLKI